jgi:23S rRNA maturation mini-RNase III
MVGWLFLSGADERLNELMTVYFQPETKPEQEMPSE